jgi:hypothetical protein
MACAVNRANCLHDLERLPSAESEHQMVGPADEERARPVASRHDPHEREPGVVDVTMRAAGRDHEASELHRQALSALTEKLGEDRPGVIAVKAWKLQDLDSEAPPM